MISITLTLMSNGDHVILQTFNYVHRRQLLTSQVGRAGIRTPSAHRTGVTIKKLLPGEILNTARAELLGIFQINRSEHSTGI